MKLYKIITIILCLLSLSVFSQNVYKGRIKDAEELPLLGATITSYYDNSNQVSANFDGDFSIKLKNPKVKISMVGYKTIEVFLDAKFNTIVLEDAIEALETIVISANREEQQRKYVAASITQLNSQEIKDTKAFGIEQLINKVSGVYMSISPSSGNEQHMMAIRTPIETKALFLFLEDGLPIRPVAVFNHNALLEMNSTSFGQVEVLKGPASSIYGSEAIGGSINFITKNPSKSLSGSVSVEGNSLNLSKVQAEVSTTFNDKYGFYLGVHKVQRKNSFIEHSDYDKLAVTFKNVNAISKTLKLTNVTTFIDFRTDMGASSVSEDKYQEGKYESKHTFSQRTAKAFRFRSTLDKSWSEFNKTSFNLIYRNNEMGQIPSYRVKWNRKTKSFNGEVNSNKFNSFAGLVQHKLTFGDNSLVIGGSGDFTQQNYWAKASDVAFNKEKGKFTDYTLNGLYKMNYNADIFNYATYAQLGLSLTDKLMLTSGVRYDVFTYDYNNNDEGKSGVKDQIVYYSNLSPKFGLNYNVTNGLGLFANYSKGFTQPQIGGLFRNKGLKGKAYDLEPTVFNSYELGSYSKLGENVKLDFTIYQLNGENRLVSRLNEEGDYNQVNAGKTRSVGVEMGLNWKISDKLIYKYNGTLASHKYLEFTQVVKNKNTKEKEVISYDNTKMALAPGYISVKSLEYRALDNLLITLQHESVGSYNTSLVGAAGKKGTTFYQGHNLFNLKLDYTYNAINFWIQGLNLFDKLYSTRASYSPWEKGNKYMIGAPRAVHGGVSYNF